MTYQMDGPIYLVTFQVNVHQQSMLKGNSQVNGRL